MTRFPNPLPALREAARGARHHLALTFALVVTVAVTATMVGATLLMDRQVETLKGYWYDKVEVSVFLCAPTSDPQVCDHPVTQAEREELTAALEGREEIKHVYYESQEQAYQRFVEQYEDNPVTQEMSQDALPSSLRVKLTDPSQAQVVTDTISGADGVEVITDQRVVLERFFAAINSIQTIMSALAAAQVVIALILVVATVRASASIRSRQLKIMRLVGARRSAITAPFVLEAGASGLIGGAAAAAALAAGKWYLVDSDGAPFADQLQLITWGDYQQVLPLLAVLVIAGPALAAAAVVTWQHRGRR